MLNAKTFLSFCAKLDGENEFIISLKGIFAALDHTKYIANHPQVEEFKDCNLIQL